MTAVLGAWVASGKRIPLYLDIRDIFVDTIKDVLPARSALLAKPVFSALERWAIKRATKVNLVSRGFAGYFEGRYPWQKFAYFTNGIDDEFLMLPPMERQNSNHSSALRVVYAGNIGEGQGLHAILPALGKRLDGKVDFRVIGDGGRKELLQGELDAAGVTSVTLLPPMARDRLVDEYRQADVLFLHLNDYEAFKRVLPSKVFEYAAMGKPIWAGISGYSAEFVRTEISNAAVFSPCDAAAAEQALASLEIRDEPRREFVKKFTRANICRELAADILMLATAP
jgi:glycosyltransferase involved in cell wall biosynthesis